MSNYIEPIAKLVHELTKLPGVGAKTALRYAYSIIKMEESDVENLSAAILDARINIKYCKICGCISQSDTCGICKNRDQSEICVVKETKDAIAIERAGGFKGQYHVLNGTLSPLDGIGPDDLRIRELLARVSSGGVKEIILALNPDVEGDATAFYIAKLLKPFGIKTSKIASGIPIGSDLEYADEVTLSRAIMYRTEL